MPKRIYDWDVVQAYYDEGHGFVQCAHRFGFCHTAWIKAIKRGALRAQSRFRDRRRKYNWAEVQGYYDLGHSYRDCRTRFGFFAAAWSKAVRRVEIKPRNATKPIAEVLGSKSSRCRKKAKLVREGYLPHRCLECGISDWRGERLAIQIDHINGIKDDWRMENLRMLCPNCDSQTATYGGRNAKRGRLLQEPIQVV